MISFDPTLSPEYPPSRLSDSREDAKVKGTRKVGGVKKRKRKFFIADEEGF